MRVVMAQYLLHAYIHFFEYSNSMHSYSKKKKVSDTELSFAIHLLDDVGTRFSGVQPSLVCSVLMKLSFLCSNLKTPRLFLKSFRLWASMSDETTTLS